MARTNATNFTGPLQFPYATAGTDIFRKEDVQTLALAVDGHDHSAGKGLTLPASALPLITSAMIADGTIATADIANGAVSQQASNFALTASAGISTASATFSTIPFMDTAITVSGTGNVILLAAFSFFVGGAATVSFGYSVDGGGDSAVFTAVVSPTSGQKDIQMLCCNLGALSAGAHTVHMRWQVSGGVTVTINQSSFQILLLEFKK
jgi:hypothetical protein